MASATQPHRPPAWRILIAGGGAAGLSLALALTRGLGGAVEAEIFDPGFGQDKPDRRAYAVSPAAARLLDGIGIWSSLKDKAQPVRRMSITDSRLADALRPDYLTFSAEDEPLAYMIEADILRDALLAACRAEGIALTPDRLVTFAASALRVTARRAEGGEAAGALLVAADGARSRLREEAGIAWMGQPYPQSGIAATITHERDHAGRAIQHFLPSGPFAILPLVPDSQGRHRSSLVWTERSDAVAALLALPGEAIEQEIAARAGPEIGAVSLETPLQAYPLAIGQARRTTSERFALLGDAAHQIHPLAGHGLNLGLGDVAALAERIADAVRLGLDPGSAPVLEAYERDRRAATLAMAASTDLLNRLFSNDNLPIRTIRDLGLGLVDRSRALKQLFVGEATEGIGAGTRLMRGEAL